MKFVAFERSKQGTGASRRLRNAGKAWRFFNRSRTGRGRFHKEYQYEIRRF